MMSASILDIHLLLLNLLHEAPLNVREGPSTGRGGSVPADQPQLAGVGQDQAHARQEDYQGAEDQLVGAVGAGPMQIVKEE